MERGRVDRSWAVLGVLLLWFVPVNGRAFATIDYQDPIERALGLKGMTAILLLRPAAGGDNGWRIEAGQRFLFGVADLRTTEARAVVRRNAWGATLSTSVLTTSIGSLTGAAIEPFLWNGRVGVGTQIGASSLAIDGFEREGLIALSASAVARLRTRLYLGYRIEGICLIGDAEPGADTVLYAVFRGAVGGVGELRIRRVGDIEWHVASSVQLTRAVEAAIGYDATAEMIHTALSVSWSGVSLSAGASVHPVLGVTKSIFVGWGR